MFCLCSIHLLKLKVGRRRREYHWSKAFVTPESIVFFGFDSPNLFFKAPNWHLPPFVHNRLIIICESFLVKWSGWITKLMRLLLTIIVNSSGKIILSLNLTNKIKTHSSMPLGSIERCRCMGIGNARYSVPQEYDST